MVAGIGFGLLFVFLDRTSDDSGVWPLLIAQVTSLPIVVSIVCARHLAFPPPRHVVAVLVGAGALAVAQRRLPGRHPEGLLSLVAVVTSLYPASTVVLATVLDVERIEPPAGGWSRARRRRADARRRRLSVTREPSMAATAASIDRRRMSTIVSISPSVTVSGHPIITASSTGPEPAG